MRCGSYLFISGQLPIDPKTGNFAGNDIFYRRPNNPLNNLKAIVKAANIGLQNVVKVNVFLANMDDFASMNSVYAKFFTEDCPAREVVQIARLPKDALV